MFGPQAGGYDRTITMFSPDGRLFQVEYAIEAVRRGSLVLGALCDEGVIILAEKRLAPLQEDLGSEKIWKLSGNIMSGISGLTADARQLVDLGRVRSEVYTLSYDEKITVMDLSREIADQMQYYTQQAIGRPFGVSLLFAGVDPKNDKGEMKPTPKILVVDPSGSISGFFATALGSTQQQAKQMLENQYKRDMKFEDMKVLMIKTLKSVLETEIAGRDFDLAWVKCSDMAVTFATTEEKNALLKLA